MASTVEVVHETGVPFEAAFAHVVRVQEGRIVRFTQVTDSRRWATAAAVIGRTRSAMW